MNANNVDSKSYIYIRKSENKGECLLEFDFGLGGGKFQSYSFQRRLSNTVKDFFNKVKHKISQIKYQKSGKKIKGIDEGKLAQCNLMLLSNNTEVDPTSILISEVVVSEMQVSISGDIYHFWNEPVWIKSVTLPPVLLVGCPIVPIFVMSHGSPTSLSFNWFTKLSNENWTKVSDEIHFTPNLLHNENQLKLIVDSPTKYSKQKFTLISNYNIQNLELPDYMLELELANVSLTNDCERRFRLMTYNLLANCYADTKRAEETLFRHCKKQFLSYKYRYPLILREILQINADVILLQEVDLKFFEKYLYPVFSKQGFNGIYQVKFSAANEGGAIFWRESRFQLLENVSRSSISQLVTQLTEENPPSPTQISIEKYLKHNPQVKSRWDGLGHSICACILKHKLTNQTLLISSNHLFYHPTYEHFRIFQAALSLDFLDKQASKYEPKPSVIYAGDFNASYEDKSIQFVLDKTVTWETENTQLTLSHNLPTFKSAFEGFLDFSNYTPDYIGLLDHIFFDSERLKVDRLSKVPSEENIKLNKFLPNKFHPSDHIPLSLDFAFIHDEPAPNPE